MSDSIPQAYHVKKGPADPFRGDWYVPEVEFSTQEEAMAKAASLTMQNYHDLKASWDQYGYEWSVFEISGETETKIWEGYKYIQEINAGGKASNLDLGLIVNS